MLLIFITKIVIECLVIKSLFADDVLKFVICKNWVSESEQGGLWTVGRFGRHVGYCQCLERVATTVL